MQKGKTINLKNQQGISLTGLIVVLAVLGLFGMLVMKVFPSYMEYRAIREGIVRAKQAGTTVAEVQQAFNKHAEVNYIDAVRGADLVINRDSGTPEVSFAYEKRIPLTDHASLVINYEGTTDPSGVVEAKAQ